MRGVVQYKWELSLVAFQPRPQIASDLGPNVIRSSNPGLHLRPVISWRKIKGQQDKGQQAWEVLRGKSASERVSEREGFQRFLEVFRGLQRFVEVFQSPSQSPSQSAIFLSEFRVLLPLIVLPLKTSTNLKPITRIFCDFTVRISEFFRNQSSGAWRGGNS